MQKGLRIKDEVDTNTCREKGGHICARARALTYAKPSKTLRT